MSSDSVAKVGQLAQLVDDKRTEVKRNADVLHNELDETLEVCIYFAFNKVMLHFCMLKR
jgi:hypothetical protein